LLLKRINLTTNYGDSMSVNFTLKRKVYFLRAGCWPGYVTALLIISTFLASCASVSSNSKILPSEIDERHPPDIQLSAKLILFEEPPIGSTSLIDMDGMAHVFLISKDQQLIHIEVLDDQIITREILGITSAIHQGELESVEHPRGKLRVLAGDKQYFRETDNPDWQEIKGNLCAQFVPVGNDLFCAFVINSKKVSAFERKHYTYGFIFPIPFVFWTYEYSSKLVLAQEYKDGWVVHAVAEPDGPLDTSNDFMVGTDNLGNLHFLYFTSKSSDWIFGGFTPYGGGIDTGSSTKSELRYAKLTYEQLLVHSTEAQNQESSQATGPEKWLTIKGAPLRQPPFIKNTLFKGKDMERVKFRPLNSDFWVNKLTGEVNGLMWARDTVLIDGDRQLNFYELAPSLVKVCIRDGHWSPNIDILAAEDFRIGIPPWSSTVNLSTKTDRKGNHHVLLVNTVPNYEDRLSMNYLFRDDVNWSAPRSLGSSSLMSYDSSLAVGDAGVAFAAWVNEKHQFVGRWIRPRSGDLE
jgi:hypothetical protein